MTSHYKGEVPFKYENPDKNHDKMLTCLGKMSTFLRKTSTTNVFVTIMMMFVDTFICNDDDVKTLDSINVGIANYDS